MKRRAAARQTPDARRARGAAHAAAATLRKPELRARSCLVRAGARPLERLCTPRRAGTRARNDKPRRPPGSSLRQSAPRSGAAATPNTSGLGHPAKQRRPRDARSSAAPQPTQAKHRAAEPAVAARAAPRHTRCVRGGVAASQAAGGRGGARAAPRVPDPGLGWVQRAACSAARARRRSGEERGSARGLAAGAPPRRAPASAGAAPRAGCGGRAGERASGRAGERASGQAG